MADQGGNNNNKAKQTKGRQKIEMKKIENEDDRLITFSKRRSGIYKKASELATLCGAEVGVVVFSPSGKPFSFAHPSIKTVAKKFMKDQEKPQKTDNMLPLVEAHQRLQINELNHQHNKLLGKLDDEKDKGKALENLKNAEGNHIERGWWEKPTAELSIEELQQVDGSLGELYENVCYELKGRGVIGSDSSLISASPSLGLNNGVENSIINAFNILGNNQLPGPSNFDFGQQQQFHHHDP